MCIGGNGAGWRGAGVGGRLGEIKSETETDSLLYADAYQVYSRLGKDITYQNHNQLKYSVVMPIYMNEDRHRDVKVKNKEVRDKWVKHPE